MSEVGTKWGGLALGTLLVTGWAGGLAVTSPDLKLRDQVQPPVRDTGLEAHETHAAATLLGQFRTSLSSWLWLRADLYLHNGVQMRPLSDFEVRSGVGGSGSADNQDKKLHDDSRLTTVVPPAERDFRGWMGDVERATSAYKDMAHHAHNDPKQALPLFRLMTWLDPQFIPGWTVGAHILVRGHDPRGVDRAFALLRQGLEHNPRNVELWGELGHLQATRGKDLMTARGSLATARRFAQSRPIPPDEDEAQAVSDVYRWLSLVHRELGEVGEMVAVAREGSARFPDDVVLRRLANPPPTPMTIERQRAWVKAVSAGSDPLDSGAALGEPSLATLRAKEAEADGHEHEHEHGHEHDH